MTCSNLFCTLVTSSCSSQATVQSKTKFCIAHRPRLPRSFSTEAMTLITSTRIPTCSSLRPVSSVSLTFCDANLQTHEKTQFRTNMFMTVSVATRINLRATPLRKLSGEISTCSPRPFSNSTPKRGLLILAPHDRCKPCLWSIETQMLSTTQCVKLQL